MIHPKPASKTFWAQAREAARSASCCSGVLSGNRLTSSDPWPQTNVSSGRFSALASRKAEASASNASGDGAPAAVADSACSVTLMSGSPSFGARHPGQPGQA